MRYINLALLFLLWVFSFDAVQAQTGKTITVNSSRLKSYTYCRLDSSNAFIGFDSTFYTYTGSNYVDPYLREYKYDTLITCVKNTLGGNYALSELGIKHYNSLNQCDTIKRYYVNSRGILTLSYREVIVYNTDTAVRFRYTATNNYNAKNEYVLNADGKRISEKNYGWDANAAAWNPTSKKISTYNHDTLISEHNYNWQQNAWLLADSIRYIYTNGLLTEKGEADTSASNGWLPFQRYTYRYDTQRRLSESDFEQVYHWVTFGNWFYVLENTQYHSYDSTGRIDTMVVKEKGFSSYYTNSSRYIYVYDSLGNYLSYDCEYWDGGGWIYKRGIDRIRYIYEPYTYTITCKLPTVDTLSGDINVCAGSPVVFKAENLANADTTAWVLPQGWAGSGGRDSILATAAGMNGSGTIQFIAMTRCGDSVIKSINVQVSAPAPVVSVAGVDQLSTTTAFASYQWYKDSVAINGAMSQSYTATQNGNYYVVVTDANGCSAASSSINLNAVGIEEHADHAAIAIYPNPNSGSFSIRTAMPSFDIVVADMMGAVVYSSRVSNNKGTTQIALPSLPAGQYILKIKEGETTLVRQLSIAK